MIKITLWISACIHFLAAIFAACSVKTDYSNQIIMMFLSFALFIGAIVDASAAIGISEEKKEQQSRARYVGGYQPRDQKSRLAPPRSGSNIYKPGGRTI